MTTKKFISAAALAFLLTAGAVSAQTGTSSTSTDDVGTPNTGSGGTVTENMAILAASGLAALAGAAYILRRRTV